MPMYEYENTETTERRPFFYKMGEAPQQRRDGDGIWQRVYSAFQVNMKPSNNGCEPNRVRRHGNLPVSLSLPKDTREGTIVTRSGQKVRKHKDGTLSTLSGRPIIRNKKDSDRFAKQMGYVKE